jgi:glycolate oxidase FAD binding subunit
VTTITDLLPLTEIIEPADPAELAQAVGGAWQRDQAIYPIGGGTSLDFGLPAKRPGLGLSLANLRRVVDYPARDMTITVEAGITMAELQRVMAAQRQHVPIDVAEAGAATLGGVIATNQSGPRRYGYGTIRDYVIGISAVDGRGTAFKAGGRVVKNVAGYDFCKLLTGSLGTLAVITQVTLKVRPLAERAAFLVAPLADLNHAESLLANLAQSRTTPVAIELLVGRAWDELLEKAAPLRIAVGLEGTEPEVAWMLDQLGREWQAAGVAAEAITAQPRVAEFWQALTEFGARRGAALVAKANVLASRTVALVDEILRIDRQAAIQAHAGSGIVIAQFAELPPEGVAGVMIKRLEPAARAAGGSAIVLRCASGGELTHPVVWGPPPADIDLMRRVKEQFDPRGLLNPGRFVY